MIVANVAYLVMDSRYCDDGDGTVVAVYTDRERAVEHADRDEERRSTRYRCAVCGKGVVLVNSRAPATRPCGHHESAVL